MRPLFAKLCAWIAASFATAATAHGVLGLVETTRAERAHVAIEPLALLLAAIVAASFCLVVRRALGDGDDRIACAIGRDIRSVRTPLAFASVACGGLATLVSMEMLEAFISFGRMAGPGEALGGNVAVVGAIVAIAAFAIVTLARRCALPVVAVTTASALRAAAWIVAVPDRIDASRAIASYRRTLPCVLRLAHGSRIGAARGLRAPPHEA